MTDGNTKHNAQEIKITNSDVEGLTRVLGQIADKLTKGEWGLLLSILAAAANSVKVDANDPTVGTFPGVCVETGAITEPRNKEIEELLGQLRNAHMTGPPLGQTLGFMVTPPKHK